MPSLESALQHLLKAKRISGEKNSYRKDNPAEYAAVKAYIDGGPRPTSVVSEMGLGLVEVEDVHREVPEPPPPPPPPPPTNTLPQTITAGGVYTGVLSSMLSIRTADPVHLKDCVITNLGTGFVIDATQVGLQLKVTGTRIVGGTGQAIRARQYKSIHIENCSIDKTWGIRLDAGLSGATVRISKCKFKNQVFDQASNGNGFWWAHSIQLADGGANHAKIEIDWNQFENVYGESWVEDIISFYRTGKGWVHDNGCRGAYPPIGFTGSYSGGGIMLGDNGGGDGLAENNIVIATMNYCIGILGGSNSKIRNNRMVNDSHTDSGVPIRQASGGLGIQIFKNDSSSIPFNNNVAENNVIGVIKIDGQPNPQWVGAGGTGNAVIGTQVLSPVDKALEDKEWQGWLNKVSAAGVKIGA